MVGVGTPVEVLQPPSMLHVPCRTVPLLLLQRFLRSQSGSMDLNDLQYHTKRGRPVICAVTEESGEGHWVVVAGVRHGRVYYQCPVDGPSKETGQEFEMRWQDHTRRGVVYTRWGVACVG